MKIDIFHTKNRYDVVLCDPPWKQTKGGAKSVRPLSSGKPLEYTTMNLDDIQTYITQINSLCNQNHSFFLWTIDKYLPQAEEIMKSLGYKLHARMIWDKVTGIPAAFTVRYSHEYLLWFYKDKLPEIAKEQRGKFSDVFREKCTRHSKKPQCSYEMIEKLYPQAHKLECFARYERDGWDVFGDEV